MERLLIMIHVVLGTCGGAESEKGQTLNGSPRTELTQSEEFERG
jgi:hypothetical protein